MVMNRETGLCSCGGLFLRQITHVAASAACVVFLYEKEVVDLSQEDDSHDDPDDDDDK